MTTYGVGDDQKFDDYAVKVDVIHAHLSYLWCIIHLSECTTVILTYTSCYHPILNINASTPSEVSPYQNFDDDDDDNTLCASLATGCVIGR